MVECIWPLSVPSSRCEAASGRGVLPLRTFIQETLRRSRTSYSTLQVALYYLILIKSHVPKHDFTMQQPEDTQSCRALQCGRRMFLAALILASKYLQDRNYSARAWAKISGLKVCEINTNEMAFLTAVNWKLHITDPTWERWQKVVLDNTPTQHPPPPGAGALSVSSNMSYWRAIIPNLTPELDVIELPSEVQVLKPKHQQEFHVRPALRTPTWTEGCSSQETTPTPSHYKLPRFLEPKPDMLPPTPTLPRMGPLPTPNLTPQSIASSTPAASAMAFGSRRPSMCAAMAQAQSASLARTCMDQWSVRTGLEAYQFSGRRPSLAPSNASSSSSPESMVMDTSRSSRASSISSVSSAGWAPVQAKLARLATCRSARLPYPAMQKLEVTEYPMEPMSSPNLDSFHIDDVEIKQFDSPLSMRSTHEKKLNGRKRGRSSVDLQKNVRHLLNISHSVSNLRGSNMVLPDRSAATSFLLPDPTSNRTPPLGSQSPMSMSPERRLPIEKNFGHKRACATEAVPTFQRGPGGPGMWKDVL
ncbi:hypothetical protein BU16DRAFT_261860 [Lophium mytilinum]|uniref:Cyclin n=1 Tax=Lophium mytilinum TaxID=390894 RepID=A0A6A6R616_9PEZI|nr:hypothetical protein BU16DRAFT_261860 [Lophium mytilinum]